MDSTNTTTQVASLAEYIAEKKRPFRVFDEGAKRDLPWRFYSTERRAITKTLELVFWDLKVGNSYSVYDARSYTLLMQVTKTVDGLRVYRRE